MRISTQNVIFTIFLASIGLVGLNSCATKTPTLDKHYGEAVNAAKSQQTLNPDASQDMKPVMGIDGKAANASVDRYHRSFVQPPPATNIFNIGVGTGGSGTATSGTAGSGSSR